MARASGANPDPSFRAHDAARRRLKCAAARLRAAVAIHRLRPGPDRRRRTTRRHSRSSLRPMPGRAPRRRSRSVAHAAHRDARREVIQQALLLRGVRSRKPDEARCLRRAGADRIDTDIAVLQIENPASREVADRGLRRRIHAESGRAFDAGRRAGENHRCAFRQKRQCFCTVKSVPFTFRSNVS